MMTRRCTLVLASLLVGAVTAQIGSVAYAAGDSPKNVIAAQIRLQGFTCDHPQRAVQDKKKSRADHEVWVLTCENATYRFSRYPDMEAKVDVLRHGRR